LPFALPPLPLPLPPFPLAVGVPPPLPLPLPPFPLAVGVPPPLPLPLLVPSFAGLGVAGVGVVGVGVVGAGVVGVGVVGVGVVCVGVVGVGVVSVGVLGVVSVPVYEANLIPSLGPAVFEEALAAEPSDVLTSVTRRAPGRNTTRPSSTWPVLSSPRSPCHFRTAAAVDAV
jgi:hypothetical protein